jgi:hypothetical protein
VRLRLPADTSARFEIETFSGEVQSDFAASWSPPQGQRRRSVVGEGDARVAIESFSGAVRIENGEDEARERRRERREERSERREERDEARAERVREEAEEQAEAEAERAEEAR